MTEVDKEGVIEQEIAVPVETTESQPPASPEPKESETSTKEYNWRKMEQKMQELERKNQNVNARNQELSQLLEEKIKSPKETSEELDQLDDEDLPSVGYSKKLAKQAARETYKEEEEKKAEEKAKREREALPGKVKKQYDDYDQVVTNENIEKLVQERAAWETTIKNDPNPYETAYCLIKQSKFYKETAENKQNQDRINSNNQKPVSSNTIGKKGPLTQANAFATQSKSDLWAEMQRYSKRASSVPDMR